MRIRKKARAVAVAIGLAVALGASAAPPVAPAGVADVPGAVTPLVKAFENDTAVDAPGAPSGCVTKSAKGAVGCWREYGDVFFVKDDLWDGESPYVLWENRLTYRNAAWGLYREGRCEYYGGSGNWGSCNKNFYEAGNTNAFGGTKSEVRIRTCRNITASTDNCSSWSAWSSNNG